MNPSVFLKHNILLNRFSRPSHSQSIQSQLFSSLPQRQHFKIPLALNYSCTVNSFVINFKAWRRTQNHSLATSRHVSDSSSSPTSLELQLDKAQAEKNLIRILEIAQELKQSTSISQDQLRLTYQHLISLLGYYGLWSQLYATVNELLDLVSIHEIDDFLWSTILDGFIQCGKSTDVIVSLLLNNNNSLGRYTISSLFRAAILESNLSQSIYLLQTSMKLDLIQVLEKSLLIQLACLFLQNNQTTLAIDLLHNFVLPLNKTDHPDCLLLVRFLRTSVDQSDPQSSLYCYSWLANHHGEIIQELIEQDSGLMIQLLNLASRHIKPELTLNILSQLVMTNKKMNSSSNANEKKKIEIEHLIPSIISLCRAGGNKMEEVIKILIRIDQDFRLIPQEIELIGFNLFVGHLGGLDQFRNLKSKTHIESSLDSTDETTDIQKSIQSLNQSEEICKKLIIHHQNNLKEKNHPHRRHGSEEAQNKIKSGVLTCLINSLIQANVEMNRVDNSVEIFKFYFQNEIIPLPSKSNSSNKTEIQECEDKSSCNSYQFNFLQPDHFTLSLMKDAYDRISDYNLQCLISNFIHHFEQKQLKF